MNVSIQSEKYKKYKNVKSNDIVVSEVGEVGEDMEELLAFILVSLVTIFLLMAGKIYSIFIDSKPTGRKTVLSKFIFKCGMVFTI